MATFKKVSADEAQSKRKEFLKDTASGLAVLKGFKSPPSWDPTNRNARFTMSSETVDRYGDIVAQAGLNTERFMQNPTALMFHNSRSWPIGNWSDVTKILNGRPKRTEGVLNFLPEGVEEDADRAARHVAAGSIKTVSIGFIPNWDEVEGIVDAEGYWTGFRFLESEMIECSLVPIPANPDALVKDAGGDFKLARDLIEEVLDTYAKTPEGLLIPMDEYRAKHMDLIGQRASIVVDKALLPTERSFVAKADMKLKAESQSEADAYVGAKVIFDQSHPENKEFPASEWLKDVGEVIASYIVDHGEKKGVHALAVEFITGRGIDGMMRGVEAGRFLLAKSTDMEEPDDNDDPLDPEEDGMKPGECAADDGSTEDMPADDQSDPEKKEISAARREMDIGTTTAGKIKSGTMEIDLDLGTVTIGVKELSAEIDEVGAKAESLISKLKSLFGFGDVKETKRIEPNITVIPEPEQIVEKTTLSPEEAEAIKAAARKELAVSIAKGHF